MNDPSKTQTAVAPSQPKKESAVEYAPFGSQDKIKLTVRMVQTYLCEPTKSGKVCSERDAMRFIALCQARRLNPWEGDCFLIGYDQKDGTAKFSLVTGVQAFQKRAEVHPDFDGLKDGVIISPGVECRPCKGQGLIGNNLCPKCNGNGLADEIEGDIIPQGHTLVGGWATCYLKNRRIPKHARLNLASFDKGWNLWESNKSGMIAKCATADVLRQSFPTVLGGMYLKEEVGSIIVDAQVLTQPTQTQTPDFLGSPAAMPPEPPKPAQEPSEPPAATPEPAGAEIAPESQPEPSKAVPENELKPAVEGLSAQDLFKAINMFLRQGNITEKALTLWARQNGLAKSNQEWTDLSVTKLRQIAGTWSEIVEAVKVE